jgi:hypothetical protein
LKTEQLRMLSPDAIEIGKVGGGWASLTPQDIAAALAGLPTGPYYLALAVHVVDPTAYVMLVTHIRGMHRIPKEAALRIGGDPVRGIVDLCLDELWGNNKCGKCEGAGVDENQQPCDVCRQQKQKAAGFKAYTDLSRAKQAGIPVEHWGQFKGFYQHLYSTFSDWNSQIQSHLTRRYGE